MESADWARQEFGSARLGDTRRVDRLVTLAAAAVARPSGYVSAVANLGAERTGAYRLLGNDEVSVKEVSAAARRACISRSQGYAFVYVAEDGSSLTVTDPDGSHGTGVVGTYAEEARGFIVMNAVVMAPDGTPLGVGGQVWWAREEPVSVAHRKRRPEEKETRHWVDLAEAVSHDFSGAKAPKPWFQFDRGGDCWYVLDEAVKRGWSVTVRSKTDRRLATAAKESREDRRLETKSKAPRKYLRETVNAAPVIVRFDVIVPAGPGRSERRATVDVRVAEVTLRLQDDRTTKAWPVRVWAVSARESAPPPGVEPLNWLLLTTRPVRDATDALDTVIGYKLRWRVEEFHRSWKSAGCNTELTHLTSAHGIQLWATILASVATRILRMTYLSRNTPDMPANVEFTDVEIEAAYLMNKKRSVLGRMPTIAVVTHLIAQAGGHAPGLRGPPPGAQILARGLMRHAIFVEALEAAAAALAVPGPAQEPAAAGRPSRR